MILRLGIAFALFSQPGAAVEWKNFPQQGHISDFAGVVDATSKRQLEAYCEALERASHVQIDFVTIPTLQGEPVADVARAFASGWNNHGVLVLLSTRERASRVEGTLPRQTRVQVMWAMGPRLREERYGEAFLEAAEILGASISSAARTQAPEAPIRNRAPWSSRVPWPAAFGAVGLILVMISLLRLARVRRERAFGGRATWGSRGSGGFGGFDSADSFGGFGGDSGSGHAAGDW
jgi:uncharacterized protein